MATTSRKKGVETIEEKIPAKRCKRHPGPLIFVQGSDDHDGQLVDKKVAEVERCRRCDGWKKLVIKLERFDVKKTLHVPVPVPVQVVEPEPPATFNGHFTLADGEKLFGE